MVCGSGWTVLVIFSVALVGSTSADVVCGPEVLSPAEPASNQHFGCAVAVNGDTMVIGASGDGYGGGDVSGAAYVFERQGSDWVEQAKLVPPDATGNDEFGASVSISGDTVVIGAPRNDGPAGDAQGSAYVFVRQGSMWVQQAKLTASDAASFDLFAASVSVSGNTTVIGAWAADGSAGQEQGAAYVFVRSGTTWSEEARLTSSDGGADDGFGGEVSLDGDMVVIGSPGKDGPAGSAQGAAYVFVRQDSIWVEEAKLTASDAASLDLFGGSVSVASGIVAVGARGREGATGYNQGCAYVFTHQGTIWTEQAKLTASDGAAGDLFGFSVGISGDTLVVGAVGDRGSRGNSQGAAYVFSRWGPAWVERAKLDYSSGTDTLSGYSVSLADGIVVVGAPWGIHGIGQVSGEADVYDLGRDDSDGDDVPDTCDLCPGTPSWTTVDRHGCVPAHGDFDLDGHVDEFDLVTFESCATGPAIPGPPAGCDLAVYELADADGDGDVDQSDFSVLQRCYSGSLGLPTPGCEQ